MLLGLKNMKNEFYWSEVQCNLGLEKLVIDIFYWFFNNCIAFLIMACTFLFSSTYINANHPLAIVSSKQKKKLEGIKTESHDRIRIADLNPPSSDPLA